jgi:hypothetical protein
VHAQLAEHCRDLICDRTRARVALHADLGVRETVHDEQRHLALGQRQLREGLREQLDFRDRELLVRSEGASPPVLDGGSPPGHDDRPREDSVFPAANPQFVEGHPQVDAHRRQGDPQIERDRLLARAADQPFDDTPLPPAELAGGPLPSKNGSTYGVVADELDQSKRSVEKPVQRELFEPWLPLRDLLARAHAGPLRRIHTSPRARRFADLGPGSFRHASRAVDGV